MIAYRFAVACVLAFSGSAALSSPGPATSTRVPVAGEISAVALHTGATYAFKSLAIDPMRGRAYLGSWREKVIVVVDLGRRASHVLPTPYDGRLNAMGVVLRGTTLYAVMNEVDDRPAATPRSALLVIDTLAERVLRSFELQATQGGRHHFNHVAVDARGLAYVSDTLKGRLYRIDTTDSDARFELFLDDPGLSWVHGLAFVDGGATLATTSYDAGLRFLSIADRRWYPFRDVTTAGDDGLAYDAGSLYAVGDNTLKRYVLDVDEHAVVRRDILLRDHPLFNDPRDLAVAAGTLYVLANLQLEPAGFDGRAARARAFDDTHVLAIPLR